MAIWLDPSQPTRAPAAGYAILSAYLVVSLLQLGAVWNDWWRESWLAGPAHVIDIVVFSVMVFLTEGYTSPFFTFFVFLLLSATIRWGWRETAITAAVVIVGFLAAGIAALQWGGSEFDLRRLLIRSAYLVVLSSTLIWFGRSQQQARAAKMPPLDPETTPGATQLPIASALAYARARTGAEQVFIAWWDEEEPWTNLSTLQGSKLHTQRFGPAEIGEVVHPELAGKPFIFDTLRKRSIAGRPTRRLIIDQPISQQLTATMGVSSGLAIPIETEDFGGVLIAQGVPALCSDDLLIAANIGREISVALQRISILRSSEDNAAAKTRLALSRDLHDSFVQILAGTSFRLEAVRQEAGSGKNVGREIESLQSDLAHQQRELRSLISQLRGDDAGREQVALYAGVTDLAGRLARQWAIGCMVDAPGDELHVPTRMQHDVYHLLRESVGNAVRHGRATEVRVTLRMDAGALRLDVSDNGAGFPVPHGTDRFEAAREVPAPRSLNERVRGAGGELSVSSGCAGTTIVFRLPLESRT
jgi:signal transduction histidine kinase